MSKAAMVPCTETSPTGTLRCDLKHGHPGPHRDKDHSINWNHPKGPYGMRKTKGSKGSE